MQEEQLAALDEVSILYAGGRVELLLAVGAVRLHVQNEGGLVAEEAADVRYDPG